MERSSMNMVSPNNLQHVNHKRQSTEKRKHDIPFNIVSIISNTRYSEDVLHEHIKDIYIYIKN